MGERKRCGVPTQYTGKWGDVLRYGICQNSPMTGMQHCRHHLTEQERAVRRVVVDAGVRGGR